MLVKLKIDNPLVINANGDAWNDIIVSDELSKSVNKVVDDYTDGKWIKKLKKGLTTEDIAKYAKQSGYDGVIFNDLVDGSIDQKPSTVYAVFDPEQIKSADIEVKDDSGNVIPLSERFNSGNEDIRYSEELSEESDILENPKYTAEERAELYFIYQDEVRKNRKEQLKIEKVKNKNKRSGLMTEFDQRMKENAVECFEDGDEYGKVAVARQKAAVIKADMDGDF